MQVLINGQSLQNASRTRGIGRYARTLLDGIRQAEPSWNLTLIEFDHLPPLEVDQQLSDGIEVCRYQTPVPFQPTEFATRWAAEQSFGRWLVERNPDVYLNPSVCEGDTIQPRFFSERIRHAAVLYDLIAVLYAPVFFTGPTVWTESYTEKLAILREADLLLAISDATARDFRRLYPWARPDLVNIAGATEEVFAPMADATMAAADRHILDRYAVTRPFLLVGGGDCWRKNMAGAVMAYARLPQHFQHEWDLVLTGKYPEREQHRLQQLAVQLGISAQVRLLGYVSDRDLAALYRACRVFLFPSLYEGLGLPVVEAHRCGTPVVTSRTSSLPEYAGPVAHYCDPLNPDSIARAVLQAVDEPVETRRAERIATGYRHSPASVGQAASAALRRLVAAPVAPARPRLAWVTPLEPPLGLANTHAELLAAAASHEVEIICQPGFTAPVPHLRCSFPILPANHFATRQQTARYDRVHRAAGAADLVRTPPFNPDSAP